MKRIASLLTIIFTLLYFSSVAADTIKHRFHSNVPDAGDPNEVGPDEWNDSLPVDGGSTGYIMMRDSTQPDGWRWVTPAGGVPTATVTGTPPATATPTPTPTPVGPQSVTCADSGNGSPGAATITVSSTTVGVTNSDADGCTLTMSESGASAGQYVTIVIVSNAGGTADLTDTAGVSEMSGSFLMAIDDSITFVYMNSAWHETARSNN